MRSLNIDLRNTVDIKTKTAGTTLAIGLLSLRIPPTVTIQLTVDQMVPGCFWKALLSYKLCSLSRLKKLALTGANDATIKSFELALLDLGLCPEELMIK